MDRASGIAFMRRAAKTAFRKPLCEPGRQMRSTRC
jgi:hypothetical protein